MRYKRDKIITGEMSATLDNGGQQIIFTGISKNSNEYYPVNEVNERVNLMGVFKILSDICKSSNDIAVLGAVIEHANNMNEIVLPNISELADDLNISRKHLSNLLSRSVDANLFHKLGIGRYLLNPYKILGIHASKANYEHQELIQVRWKEVTGLFTELELEKLLDLSKYLELEVGLRPTEFNLSVAEYFHRNKSITDKQRKAIMKK